MYAKKNLILHLPLFLCVRFLGRKVGGWVDQIQKFLGTCSKKIGEIWNKKCLKVFKKKIAYRKVPQKFQNSLAGSDPVWKIPKLKLHFFSVPNLSRPNMFLLHSLYFFCTFKNYFPGTVLKLYRFFPGTFGLVCQ